jgi:hypothetical protein
VECDSIGSAKSRLSNAGFSPSVGAPIDSKCPAGTAAGTNPDGRTIKGGVVVINTSNGNGGKKDKPGLPPGLPGFPGNGKPPRR